jgi:hypothetical protein
VGCERNQIGLLFVRSASDGETGVRVRRYSDDEVRQLRESLAAHRARREAAEAAAIEEARRTSGKEPFTVEALQALYDTSLDTGDHPVSPGDIREYEYRYYLSAPDEVRTVAQFAEYLLWLHKNDAG